MIDLISDRRLWTDAVHRKIRDTRDVSNAKPIVLAHGVVLIGGVGQSELGTIRCLGTDDG
jgi:hypothetical protein